MFAAQADETTVYNFNIKSEKLNIFTEENQKKIFEFQKFPADLVRKNKEIATILIDKHKNEFRFHQLNYRWENIVSILDAKDNLNYYIKQFGPASGLMQSYMGDYLQHTWNIVTINEETEIYYRITIFFLPSDFKKATEFKLVGYSVISSN